MVRVLTDEDPLRLLCVHDTEAPVENVGLISRTGIKKAILEIKTQFNTCPIHPYTNLKTKFSNDFPRPVPDFLPVFVAS